MAHWNYRLVRKVYEGVPADEGGVEVYLTEVYYDDAGRPDGYIEGGCRIGGDTAEDVRKVLTMAAAALNLPVLEEADLDKQLEAPPQEAP